MSAAIARCAHSKIHTSEKVGIRGRSDCVPGSGPKDELGGVTDSHTCLNTIPQGEMQAHILSAKAEPGSAVGDRNQGFALRDRVQITFRGVSTVYLFLGARNRGAIRDVSVVSVGGNLAETQACSPIARWNVFINAIGHRCVDPTLARGLHAWLI